MYYTIVRIMELVTEVFTLLKGLFQCCGITIFVYNVARMVSFYLSKQTHARIRRSIKWEEPVMIVVFSAE